MSTATAAPRRSKPRTRRVYPLPFAECSKKVQALAIEKHGNDWTFNQDGTLA
jgi:hypothetical protein